MNPEGDASNRCVPDETECSLRTDLRFGCAKWKVYSKLIPEVSKVLDEFGFYFDAFSFKLSLVSETRSLVGPNLVLKLGKAIGCLFDQLFC